LERPGSRIVTISSEGHTRGMIDFEDLQSENGYRPAEAYCQSKLANLLFTYELDRRLRVVRADTIALACHPGIVLTSLYRTRSKFERALLDPRLRLINSRFVQSAQMGALPTLRAATDSSAQGGEFYGPRRGYTGYPVSVESSARSHNEETQRRLWQESERLTGVTYSIRVTEQARPLSPRRPPRSACRHRDRPDRRTRPTSFLPRRSEPASRSDGRRTLSALRRSGCSARRGCGARPAGLCGNAG